LSVNAPIVAIDTNILVWGIRKQGDSEQMKRALWLFELLNEQNAKIIVPSIVLAEYVAGCVDNQIDEAVSVISTEFIIAPFDTMCAKDATHLFKKQKDIYPSNLPNSRSLLKADAMIVATAYRHGADVFYTGDQKCLKMAQTIMTAKDLPNQPNSLFDY